MPKTKRRVPDECEVCGEPLELDDDDDCIYCGAERGVAEKVSPPPKPSGSKRQSSELGGGLRKWLLPAIFLGIVYYQRTEIEELRSIAREAHSQAFENDAAIRELRSSAHTHE